MNDMEKFLSFGAVVKVRRFSDDELYNFVKLIKSMGCPDTNEPCCFLS